MDSTELLKDPERLVEYLQMCAASVLGLDSAALEVHRPLDTLGMDSLMAIELRNNITDSVGITLPVVNLLKGPTVAELADELREYSDSSMPAAETIRPITSPLKKQPLSYGQQAMWFVHQLLPEGSTHSVELGQHAGVLRALAGKQKGQLALATQALLEVIDAAAVLDAPALGLAQPARGETQLAGQVLRRRGHDAQPAGEVLQPRIERERQVPQGVVRESGDDGQDLVDAQDQCVLRRGLDDDELARGPCGDTRSPWCISRHDAPPG